MKIEDHIEKLRKRRVPIEGKPKGTRILIADVKPSEKTAGGIYKPDAAILKEAKETPLITIALKVGDDVKDVKEGNILYLAKNTPMAEIKLGGQSFSLIDEYDIMYITE